MSDRVAAFLEALALAEENQKAADRKFDQLIVRARRGQKNLELAAATAAGMSHSARKIAAKLRAALEKQP